jgi:hypothetical protein
MSRERKSLWETLPPSALGKKPQPSKKEDKKGLHTWRETHKEMVLTFKNIWPRGTKIGDKDVDGRQCKAGGRLSLCWLVHYTFAMSRLATVEMRQVGNVS